MQNIVAQLLETPLALWSALSFFAGLLIGHWLSIGRDDRNRRAATFERVRKEILSLRGDKTISAADEDAILAVCRPLRRKHIRSAILDCKLASHSYYDREDEWGSRLRAPTAEERMTAAHAALAEELRRI